MSKTDTTLRAVQLGLSVLSIASAFLTGAGLILAACLENSNLADLALSYYPRYTLAQQGFRTLQDFKYPLQDSTGTINVAVLSINEPGWFAILDFIQSETAIRKSERNEAPLPISQRQPGSPSGDATQPPPVPTPLTNLPPVNYARIKTIVALKETAVISAGSKALVPPYKLLVISPVNVPRRLYEYLSLEEFQLDLRKMAIDELEGMSLWLAVVAFGCGLLISALERLVRALEGKRSAIAPIIPVVT